MHKVAQKMRVQLPATGFVTIIFILNSRSIYLFLIPYPLSLFFTLSTFAITPLVSVYALSFLSSSLSALYLKMKSAAKSFIKIAEINDIEILKEWLEEREKEINS